MLILILLLIPLLGGVLSFTGNAAQARGLSLASSLLSIIAGVLVYNQFTTAGNLSIEYSWIPSIGAKFSLGLSTGDNLALLMILLTLIVFPLIYLCQLQQQVRSRTFYGLMQWAQCGLLGVFLSRDALLFYIFWELALIPVYFLCSFYGGPRRIPVTFKFFVYTFGGSLLMLIGFLLIYRYVPLRSFSWDSLVSAGSTLPFKEQQWIFWLMFLAFAIKMPVFPFHTWQPDTYEQSDTSVTIVLSAIMVKMGLFSVIRWLLPLLPEASKYWMNLVIAMCIIGVVFASAMALVQQNVKRLIAYSSIAHIGLMCAAIFSHQLLGIQGAAIQMFNHGITITGLWLLVSILENRLHTTDLQKMGGLAQFAPWFTVSLVLISLSNIALPLTNGFIGEFMMFNALFTSDSGYRIVFTLIAGLGIILSAVYTLRMVQQIAFGSSPEGHSSFQDLGWAEKLVMAIIMSVILILGFYPKLIIDLVYTQTS